MMRCVECQTDKPDSEFHPGYRRCKECTNQAQNASRWYAECHLKPVALWPDKLTTYLRRCLDLSAAHPQATFTKAVTDMLAIYSYTGELPPSDLTLEILWQELQGLRLRVDALEHGEASTQRRRDTARDYNRFTDAVAKAGVDAEVKLALHRAYSELPCITPATLRSIVLPYESTHTEMPLGLIQIYNQWFLPAFLEMSKMDNYEELVNEVAAITGINYYEVDWVEIPTE